jgi:Domain of unknown function (DUF4781)
MFSMRLTAIRKSLGRIAAVVGESLAAKAAALMQCPAGSGSADDPHSQARTYALDALQAVSGDWLQTPTDYAPLRQTLEGLGPAAAARFVQALNPSGSGGSDIINSRARERILVAMNAGAYARTTGAVVQTIFAQISPGELHVLPAMQQHLARALAREWYPNEPIKRIAETNRLAGIFDTVQGQQLLFGSGDAGNIPLDARVNALAIIRANSSITAATLTKTVDPWMNMAIVGPMAQANARQHLTLRGDAPQTLRGSDLDNVVGYALGFPPTTPPGVSPALAQTKAATQAFSYYAQGPAQQPVQAVVDQIRRLGGADPQVTVLPIEYSSSGAGPVRLPLFRLRTANGDGYVDNTGRGYCSLQDWKDHNQLPPGIVIFPDQGLLTADEGGSVKLDGAATPATPDKRWKQVQGVINDAVLVGGITADGALIIGPDVVGTPVVADMAIVSGAWPIDTAGGELLNDSTGHCLWLDLAADTAGMGAFASEAALANPAPARSLAAAPSTALLNRYAAPAAPSAPCSHDTPGIPATTPVPRSACARAGTRIATATAAAPIPRNIAG